MLDGNTSRRKDRSYAKRKMAMYVEVQIDENGWQTAYCILSEFLC